MSDSSNQGNKGAGQQERPWLGIKWDCCNAYTRVYRAPEATAYLGRCPKCLRTVRVRVAPGGTDSRIFRAR